MAIKARRTCKHCCLSVRALLSLEMRNHSSFCLLTGLLNISSHPSKSSHGQQPQEPVPQLLVSWGQRAPGVVHSQEVTVVSQCSPPASCRHRWGWCWAPGQPNSRFNSSSGLTSFSGESTPFPPNRLLRAGSMMAINKFRKRSAGFRLATKMGGEKKLGILQQSTNHGRHRELRTWNGKRQNGLTGKWDVEQSREQTQNERSGQGKVMPPWPGDTIHLALVLHIALEHSSVFPLNQFSAEEKKAALKAWNKKAWRQRTIPGWWELSEGSFPCETNNLPTAELCFPLKQLALVLLEASLDGSLVWIQYHDSSVPWCGGSGIRCTYQQRPSTARFPWH